MKCFRGIAGVTLRDRINNDVRIRIRMLKKFEDKEDSHVLGCLGTW